jgi:hypothetical protein
MKDRRTALRVLLLSTALAVAAAFTPAFGAETEYGIITTEQLKTMMDGKKVFTLVDARTKEE